MKVIKFDTLYPAQYLEQKIISNRKSIKKMSFYELNDWLIRLRLNFSDYFSYNLSEVGWQAKDFFILGNGMYIRKIGFHYFGIAFLPIYFFYKFFGGFQKSTIIEIIIRRIIKKENPNVIFIREHSLINSLFWDSFRDKALVVSRMECSIPKYWSPACFDVIYTNINTYRDYFKSNRIKTRTLYSGFDSRLISEIKDENSEHFDIAFVGGLGSNVFKEKTLFLESVLNIIKGKYRFGWWGYKENKDFDHEYPLLADSYLGVSGGLDMFRIYKYSGIILNDYGLLAGGQGMNQRIYEVLGVGGFLLTRNSKMFEGWDDCIATFDSVEDCCEKIEFYLSNKNERELIAQKGHEFVIKNFNYKDIMSKLSDELKEDYKEKFGSKIN